MKYAMGEEKVPTPSHANGKLGVNRSLGDTELSGDLAVRKPLEPAQDKDFAASRRQHLNGFAEYFKVLSMTGKFGGVGFIL